MSEEEGGRTAGASGSEATRGAGSAARATLVGVATGRPDGGVAMVRLSGPRAKEIAAALIDGELPSPRRLLFRRLRLGAQGFEEALVVQMPGPDSFTGEDVVEFQIHGGERNVEALLARLLAGGAAAAGAGDFSRRAFAHGRRSLDQLEGIAALVGARTDAALRQARRLVAGELGLAVDRIREEVSGLRTEVEAHLDFPEDVGTAEVGAWISRLRDHEATIERWLLRFERGRRAREGTRIVIAGPPNAGKSALFNALLGRSRALVSPEAGTTRDYVEAALELGGRYLVLVDTAGLRDSEDVVEGAGVALSRAQIAGADMVVWLEAADMAAVDSERGAALGACEAGGVEAVLVESKVDLGRRRPDWIGISVEDASGERDALLPLLEALEARLGDPEEAWIGLARHRARAEEALDALRRARSCLAEGMGPGPELAAFELRIAAGRLKEIGGGHGAGAVGADVLDAIFSRFCIGK